MTKYTRCAQQLHECVGECMSGSAEMLFVCGVRLISQCFHSSVGWSVRMLTSRSGVRASLGANLFPSEAMMFDRQSHSFADYRRASQCGPPPPPAKRHAELHYSPPPRSKSHPLRPGMDLIMGCLASLVGRLRSPPPRPMLPPPGHALTPWAGLKQRKRGRERWGIGRERERDHRNSMKMNTICVRLSLH